MTSKPNILMLLTSSPHGWYLPELAHPYSILSPSCNITIASPLGGLAPLDPGSVKQSSSDVVSMAFHANHAELWENTVKLDDISSRVDEFAVIFVVGGYGAIFDLPTSPTCTSLILQFHAQKKIISGICHGPAAFSRLQLPGSSKYLLEGHVVTGISDAEIAILSSGIVEPFSVEESLSVATRGRYEKADEPFGAKVVVSVGEEGGRVVVTGQNPASGEGVGKAIYELLFGRK